MIDVAYRVFDPRVLSAFVSPGDATVCGKQSRPPTHRPASPAHGHGRDRSVCPLVLPVFTTCDARHLFRPPDRQRTNPEGRVETTFALPVPAFAACFSIALQAIRLSTRSLHASVRSQCRRTYRDQTDDGVSGRRLAGLAGVTGDAQGHERQDEQIAGSTLTNKAWPRSTSARSRASRPASADCTNCPTRRSRGST